MDRIPDEVLMMILDFLPSHIVCLTVSRVCRRWARLASIRAVLVNNSRAFRRWCRGRGVRALLLTAREPLCVPSFVRLAATAHLTELTVHLGLAFGTGELVTLSSLRLNHVDVFCRAEVLNSSAVPLAARVASLVINEPVYGTFLHMLAQGSRLKALHMYGRAGCYPRHEMMELIDSHRDRFEDLTLRCPTLKEADYANIGRCAALRSLRLYSCWEMTLVAALHVVELQQLRRLHLTGTRKHLDSCALHRVVARLPPGLAELSLSASWLRDEHVSALARRAVRLRRVELWRTQLSARGVVRLAASLPLLQELDVDVAISRRLLVALALHPTLETVRCQLPKEKIETHLRLLDTEDCHGGRVSRSEGEGYRAQLFYYWTQDVPLAPPHARPPHPPLAPPALVVPPP